MINLFVVEGFLGSNGYIVTFTDSKKCFIVDCGNRFNEFEKIIKANNLIVEGVLLTHGHFDHSFCVSEFEKWGIPIYISKEDLSMINGESTTLADEFGLDFTPIKNAIVIEDEINICDKKIKVLHTAGHTKGSVCYILDDMLFSGDTLFCGSVGRTDLPTGDNFDLQNSLKLLKGLDNFKVYPGHGDETTIENEKENNPYLRWL